MLRATVVLVVFASHLAENHAWGTPAARKIALSMHTPIASCDCRHSICNNVADYPEREIDRAMEGQHTLQSLLRGKVFDAASDVMIVSNRDFESNPELIQLCPSDGPVTYSPRTMRNWEGHCKFIVNTDKYQQTFTADSCRTVMPNNKEEESEDDLCPKTMGMKCVQNYQSLSLLTYENGTVQFEIFQIPLVCKCCSD